MDTDIPDNNLKLRSLLKQAQAKRNLATKQCAQAQSKAEQLQEQLDGLKARFKDDKQKNQSSKMKMDELKFLNRTLADEMDQLRARNEQLTQKVRYMTEVLEKKYQQFEEGTVKRVGQALKRIKKEIHYLETMNAKEIQKVRDTLVTNLRRAVDLLKNRNSCQDPIEDEISQLMNPLKSLQQEVGKANREIGRLKQENQSLTEEVKKLRTNEKELFPQYKEALQKFRKALARLRVELAQNQQQKVLVKRKYQDKLKQSEHKYNQLYVQLRKTKLERTLYENKLQEMEVDQAEEKDRLMDENQMLKQLYHDNQKDKIDHEFKKSIQGPTVNKLTASYEEQSSSDWQKHGNGHHQDHRPDKTHKIKQSPKFNRQQHYQYDQTSGQFSEDSPQGRLLTKKTSKQTLTLLGTALPDQHTDDDGFRKDRIGPLADRSEKVYSQQAMVSHHANRTPKYQAYSQKGMRIRHGADDGQNRSTEIQQRRKNHEESIARSIESEEPENGKKRFYRIEENSHGNQGHNERMYENQESEDEDRLSKHHEREPPKYQQRESSVSGFHKTKLSRANHPLRHQPRNKRTNGGQGQSDVHLSGSSSEGSSLQTPENLKDEIYRIDQQIMEIHKNLTRQFEVFK